MEANFWHQKWANGEIAFHQSAVNPLLVAHFAHLKQTPPSRIFLPLCGKTQDIAWLLAQGYQVVGVELSGLAITHLFNDLGLEPDIAHIGTVTRYSAPAIDILVGDIFDVSADRLGPVSAIVDRAALVALPENMRTRYTSHLINLTDAAPQLLITYQYNQALVAGPPFSVTDAEVKRHYGAAYHLTPLESQAVAGGLKGGIAVTETVWLLQKAHK